MSQSIGGEPVTNTSELLSDEIKKVEATKNKETTPSHRNKKRKRIKYEYLA